MASEAGSTTPTPTTPPFIVRPGVEADLADVVRLTCELARETENGLVLPVEKVTAGCLAGLLPGGGQLQPRYFLAIAPGTGAVVGSVCISPEWSDWWNTTYWWVASVFVDAAYRRQGAARCLFNGMQEVSGG
jgi:hypothetical protein